MNHNSRQILKNYLARSLYRRDWEDVEAVFEFAKLMHEEMLGKDIICVPCHISDVEALLKSASLYKDTDVSILVLLNCGPEEITKAKFQKLAEKLHTTLRRITSQRGAKSLVLGCRDNKNRTMGRIRGLMVDACILLALHNGYENGVVCFNDSDTLSISSDYFEELKNEFATCKPQMVVGPTYYGYDHQGLPAHSYLYSIPELYLFDRINRAILKMARIGKINFEKRIWLEGANFSFTLSGYCLVDGFDWQRNSGEDDEIGRAFHRYQPEAFEDHAFDPHTIFRQENDSTIAYLESAWLSTDPRRVLNAILSTGNGYDAWTNGGFQRNLGSSFSTEELVKRYHRSDGNIQQRDVAEMIQTMDEDGLHRTADRIVQVCGISLKSDRRIRNSKQERAVLSELELLPHDKDTLSVGSREHIEFVSKRLQYLSRNLLGVV